MTITERLRMRCKEKGTSFNALEKELGLGNGTIRRWDEKVPGVDKAQLVANRLEISLEWLVTGKNGSDLTPEEQQLIDLYRQADERGKRSIIRLAQDEARELGLSTSGTGSTGTDS
ncbi:MAG: helix-turn-helix transcriptional regulator [Lachnospiraceae bacterium]|nr:helix-turn-helix transcriptional regulator [Lachnospiraceae bacterium]